MMGEEASASGIGPTAFWAWYGLIVMMLVSMAGNAIPPVFTLLTDAIKTDLSLSDTQIGALRGLAVTLVVAIASFPIAWIADRIDRRIVFAVCMVIWSLSTIGMGLSHGYGALFAFGIGLAFGEAVLGPVTYPILADLFPPERRTVVNSIFFVSQLLGYSAALIFGGWLIPTVDAVHASLPDPFADAARWRAALSAAALPSLALIPFVLAIRLRRSTRVTAVAGQVDDLWGYILDHRATLFPIFIGFGLIGSANFVAVVWLPVAMTRSLSISPAIVGVALGQVYAVASIAGVVIANLLVRWLNRRNAETAPLRVAQMGALVAVVVSPAYLLATAPWHFYVISGIQIAGSVGGLVLSPTLAQNIAPPRLLARVFAINGLFYVGLSALNPFLVGVISDAMGQGTSGLLYAILIVALPTFALGVAALQLVPKGLSRTLAAARDETR